MEKYVGKTLIDALRNAAKSSGKSLGALRPMAHVIMEKKTLLYSQVVIGIFDEQEVFKFACEYLDKLLDLIHAKATYQLNFDAKNQVIEIDISTDCGNRVIGKNGENLKALNNLTRSAVFASYGGDYRILLDCEGYKRMKYQKIASMAIDEAKDVQSSHVPSIMPSMPSDERLVIHKALSGMRDIQVVSVDEGKHRHIVIRYMLGNVVHSDYDE